MLEARQPGLVVHEGLVGPCALQRPPHLAAVHLAGGVQRVQLPLAQQGDRGRRVLVLRVLGHERLWKFFKVYRMITYKNIHSLYREICEN